MKKTLIMMCGLPGSGKSTVANQLVYILDHPKYFSLDQTREYLFGTRQVQKCNHEVWQMTMVDIMRAFRERDIVIYDAVNIDPKARIDVIKKLKEMEEDFDVFCVFLDTPIDIALKRNKERPKDMQVPYEVISSFRFRLVEPSFKEELDGQQIFKDIYKIYPQTLNNSVDIVCDILTKQIKEQ